MIKFFYGTEIEAINWKIAKFCYDNNLSPCKIDSSLTLNEIEKKIFQLELFNSEKNILYIIDFSKLVIEKKNDFLAKLISAPKNIIFFHKTNSLDRKLIDKSGIIAEKITSLSWDNKREIIYFFLNRNKIEISKRDIEYMCSSLLTNHYFIENEISKISLLSKSYSIESIDIRQVLFDCFNLNVFKIIDFWLRKKYNDLLKILNEIAYNSSQTQWIIQIFITKLIQIKMFILAIKSGVDTPTITSNLQIPIFQQKIYRNLYLSSKNILNSINEILVKLWNLEIGVKSNEMYPFFTFVKILLDDHYDKW